MSIVPDDATPIPNPPYTYWLWPELVNDGITPIVRVHITTWEDPDADCHCLDVELEGDVRDQVWEALEDCRMRATQLLWDETGWVISGSPTTEFSCSHDIDPRNEDDYYVT